MRNEPAPQHAAGAPLRSSLGVFHGHRFPPSHTVHARVAGGFGRAARRIPVEAWT